MSCCGQSRSRPGPGVGGPPPATPGNPITPPATSLVAPTPARSLRLVFEYLGATALTVVGPVSGRRYHFPASGARLTVDPRDRPGLARVPKLRQVS